MKKNAFTLIELLIVVGIIGILAAIAMPTYRDAITKSRIAQVKVDLKNLGTALESYRIDHNKFPRRENQFLFFADYLLPDLTSPIAYLGTIKMNDPFGKVQEYEEPVIDRGTEGPVDAFGPTYVLNRSSYTYIPYFNFAMIQGQRELQREGFALASIGPDRQDSYIVDYPFPLHYRYPGDTVRDSVYNPSNGIMSPGDIAFFGGELPVQGLIGG